MGISSRSWQEKARHKVFWWVDRARGSAVSRGLRDTARLFFDLGAARETCGDRLAVLLAESRKHVPFYRRHPAARELSQLPVVNKQLMADHPEWFRSRTHRRSRLKTVATSGSHGTPTVFYHCKTKMSSKLADVIFFNSLVGYQVGDVHALIRTKPKVPMRLWFQNEILMLATRLNRRQVQEYAETLLHRRVRFVIGHPSIMVEMARYSMEASRSADDYVLEGFIGAGEPLLEADRETIRAAFGCPAIGRYASEEAGVLAHELPDDRRYHLNHASYHFELLSLDSDDPVPPGRPGRLVITDLSSFAMPLIRYDTGDVAVLSAEPSMVTGGPVLERIEGRVLETIHDTAGNRIFPLAIYDRLTGHLSGTGAVARFQLVQEDRTRYCLRLVPSGRHELGTNVLQPMRADLIDVLGADADLRIEFPEGLERLRSGKQPITMNALRQTQTIGP